MRETKRHGGARPNAGRKPSDKKPVTKRLSKDARDHLAILAEQVDGDETYAMEQAIMQTKKIPPKS